VDPTDAAEEVRATGLFVNDVLNRSVLPLGQTFVKGVEVADGHLVRQAMDILLPGVNFNLEMARTYSSSAKGTDGAMGAGWAWTYDHRVIQYKGKPGDPDLYVVRMANGESQVFETTDDSSFTPQRGYHQAREGEARRGRQEVVVFDFRDKPQPLPLPPAQAAVRARRVEARVHRGAPRRPDPGDLRRLGRVSQVWDAPGGRRRALTFSYERHGDFDRISEVQDFSGIVVRYRYDAVGNLIEALRTGANVAGQPAAPAHRRATSTPPRPPRTGTVTR
jgi:YD repeat-containing protein